MKKASLLIFILSLLFLSSCGSSELTFSEILNNKASNVEKITAGGDPPETKIVIVDKVKIKQFINIMESTKYKKSKPYDDNTGGALVLYNSKDVEIAVINSWEGIYKINNHYYQPTKEINKKLGSFFTELRAK